MTLRKRWSTTFPRIASGRICHESKAAAYRWVHKQAENQRMLRSTVVAVYVDERNGVGWELYETIDLKETPNV